MKLVFAGEGEWLVRVLTKEGAPRWLRSYYALQNNTEALLATYVPLEPVKPRMPKQSKRKLK